MHINPNTAINKKRYVKSSIDGTVTETIQPTVLGNGQEKQESNFYLSRTTCLQLSSQHSGRVNT